MIISEGLRPAGESGARRITGSPRVVPQWQEVMRRACSEIDQKVLDPEIKREGVRLTRREEWEKLDLPVDGGFPRRFALGHGKEHDTVLGPLSDLTGDPRDVARVTVRLKTFYSDPSQPDPRGALGWFNEPFRFSMRSTPTDPTAYSIDYERSPIPESVRTDPNSSIDAGGIEINMGEMGVKSRRDVGSYEYRKIGFILRDKARNEGSIAHELLHLSQHLYDRLSAAVGRYARYGRPGDRPGKHVEDADIGKNPEHRQPLAIEPDAYSAGIIASTRQRYKEWVGETFFRASGFDKSLRQKISDRGARTDMARDIMEQEIKKSLQGRSHFSGAVADADTVRYVRMRVLNSLERIVEEQEGAVKRYEDIWRKEGWKRVRKIPTNVLAFQRHEPHAAIQDIILRLHRLDSHLLELLDYAAGMFDAMDLRPAREDERTYDVQAELSSKGYELIDHVLESDLFVEVSQEVREAWDKKDDLAYQGELEEDWLRGYASSWFGSVMSDLLRSGGEVAIGDPMIPSLGAEIIDNEIMFYPYDRKKHASIPEPRDEEDGEG